MICNFPVNTKHIVIQKEESASLVSILNWGLRVKWFNTKEEAIFAAAPFKADINEYYKFWGNLSKKTPTQVQLINCDLLIKHNSLLEKKLRKLNIKVKFMDLSVEEVPQSPNDRKKLFPLAT